MFCFASALIPSVDSLLEYDWLTVIRTALFFAALAFGAGTILRLIFGKQAPLTRAVSASLTVLLLYLGVSLAWLFLPSLRQALTPLPFVSVDEQRLVLWELSSLPEQILYAALVRLSILALLVNAAELLLPQGEGVLSWYLWRGVTVVLTFGLYSLICTLVETYVPGLFGSWAKPVLLAWWALILLSGVLKLLLTLVLAAVNPIVAALYAFFFSNIVGRQFSKAILTTLILMALAACLNHLGLSQLLFSDFHLAAYLPTCLIVAVTAYLFGKFL